MVLRMIRGPEREKICKTPFVSRLRAGREQRG
jgi:hypothetical protein